MAGDGLLPVDAVAAQPGVGARGRPLVLAVQLAVAVQAAFGQLARPDGRADGAPRFGAVGAVAEAALACLSPDLRAALQATVLDGLTTKEAARLLGVPEGTVKTRVMRAKARLREDLA